MDEDYPLPECEICHVQITDGEFYRDAQNRLVCRKHYSA